MDEIKRKVAVDANNNVMAFQYQSASLELEVDPYDEAFISEPLFTDQQVNRFKVVDGVVVRRTEEEIKADPIYSQVVDEQKRSDFKQNTDSEFIRALRELLQVPEIRKLLSDETQQRLANNELEVEKIKAKFKE